LLITSKSLSEVIEIYPPLSCLDFKEKPFQVKAKLAWRQMRSSPETPS
jgi:hypothetical protein